MFEKRREHLKNMKNKYLTKYLCITIMSAMILSGAVSALGADSKALPSGENIRESSERGAAPVPSVPAPSAPDSSASSSGKSEPSVTSGQVFSSEGTPVPGAGGLTPAPSPENSKTPTPGMTPTPGPGLSSGGSAAASPGVSQEPGSDFSPETSVTPGPEAEPSVTPGAELSVTPDPELSVTPGPELPVTPGSGSETSPDPGVTEAPVTPVPELSVTPDPELSVTPGPELSVTPGPELSVPPGPELSVTPGPELSVTPGPELSVTPGPELSVTPDPELSVTPDPELSVTPEPELSVTPDPELSVTPDPELSVTPTPELSVTPTPMEIPEAVQSVIYEINELTLIEEITLELEPRVTAIREAYNQLTEEEQALVTNYPYLAELEIRIAALKEQNPGGITDGTTVAPNAVQGQPVYFSTIPSNLHAGKDFYLNNLKNKYQLTFSEDFAGVMDEIEAEYKEKMKLADVSDLRKDGVTSSSDMLLVRNWQDILAVYVYEKQKDGMDSFQLDSSCKEELAEIFEEMNPVVRDKQNITRVSYGNRHINYYIRKNKLKAKQRKILQKYVETDCKLLCATVTAAKGFVRESVGDDVSEERVNVISAAYSLVGKVGYFWGGKSTVLGEDPSWGSVATVSAAGSPSTGTLRAYGLDCSGFVTWAVVNGYQNRSMQLSIGDGTSNQWSMANVVSEADAQPGDLVFQRGPEAGINNHVGIICGKTDAGDWIAVHCSSSKNGVTVGEAYSASFRYIRQPSFYPTQTELAALDKGSLTATEKEVVVSSSLQEALKRSLKSQELMDSVKLDFTADAIEIFEEQPEMTAEAENVPSDGTELFTGGDSVEVFGE